MCGIAGQLALHPDRVVDEDQVRQMLRGLRHRGPDGEGVFLDPARRVALGSRRLAVIDLVTGEQPIDNEDGSITCVFNGEIYNFQHLRERLERQGHRFRTMTDTEAIVHLYEEEGAECLRHLRGMFALALWDARRRALLLARDRLGKKPLYYVEANGVLTFASEIQVLYDLPGLSREVDPVALDLYLTHAYVPAPFSILRAIRKLPPASALTVRDASIECHRYWWLRPDPPLEAPRDELVRLVSAKLEEAVRLRMISDVPLGCFLSGGVDSSSVVALMSKCSNKPVKTYSIGFTSDRFNELPYARTVAERFGTEHHEFTVRPEAAAILPQIIRHFGEPFGDSSAVPTWYVAKIAREHVTVALNGDGGDELFGGYAWYRTGLALDRIATSLPNSAIRSLAWGASWMSPRAGRLGRRLAMAPSERFASLRRNLDAPTRHHLYTPALLSACGTEAERYLPRHYEAAPGDMLARMQATDVATYLAEDLLVKVDRMTSAHSLEGRSPFLDHELLELTARIPARHKVGRRGGKLLLREAMGPLFPPRFLDRPKMGFSVPVANWLSNELRDECYRTVCGDALLARGWFKASALRRFVTEGTTGAEGSASFLWSLFMLGAWVRAYLP